jgi:hypothetical protein
MGKCGVREEGERTMRVGKEDVGHWRQQRTPHRPPLLPPLWGRAARRLQQQQATWVVHRTNLEGRRTEDQYCLENGYLHSPVGRHTGPCTPHKTTRITRSNGEFPTFVKQHRVVGVDKGSGLIWASFC